MKGRITISVVLIFISLNCFSQFDDPFNYFIMSAIKDKRYKEIIFKSYSDLSFKKDFIKYKSHWISDSIVKIEFTPEKDSVYYFYFKDNKDGFSICDKDGQLWTINKTTDTLTSETSFKDTIFNKEKLIQKILKKFQDINQTFHTYEINEYSYDKKGRNTKKTTTLLDDNNEAFCVIIEVYYFKRDLCNKVIQYDESNEKYKHCLRINYR